MSDTIKSESELLVDGLSATSKLSIETGYPGPGIRPCLATLLDTSLRKGEFPKRDSAVVAIAAELKRIGQTFDQVIQRTSEWNSTNRPPLSPNELERAVGNVFAKDYNYGCDHAVLQANCVGRESCPFIQNVKARSKRPNDLKFIDYGWPDHLTHSQTLIYSVSLPYFEKTQKIGKGGRICKSHLQIAKAAGISQRRVGEHLTVLANIGLIDYKPGEAQKWKGIASEIRRIFPVPKPLGNTLKKLKFGGNDA